MNDVLKCNVYLPDIRTFQAMNEVSAEVAIDIAVSTFCKTSVGKAAACKHRNGSSALA
jgi:enamine deaminase RidA (YjgF/YER057c/UK114 family)